MSASESAEIIHIFHICFEAKMKTSNDIIKWT